MATAARRGVCLVISAPSGAGKSSIVNALRAADSCVRHSVSVTTRAPRPGEKEGIHYYFRTSEQFAEMVRANALLEWAEVFGQGYGTPREAVESTLASGCDIVFDLDWQGHRLLRKALPDDVVSLFVFPPSLEELQRRLKGRASDDSAEIQRRLNAAQAEMAHWREFDHVLTNNELDRAVQEAQAILTAARLRTSRQRGLDDWR